MSTISTFFTWLSAATPEVLERDECREAQSKYVAIGQLACFPALFGAVAATVTVSHWASRVTSLLSGFFVGLFIVSVERVVLMQTRNVRRGIGWRGVAPVIARGIFAAAVGVVITTGFSLTFFRTAVDRELAKRNVGEIASARATADSLVGGELSFVRAERQRIANDVAARVHEADQAAHDQRDEGEGKRSPYGPGAGPLWRADSARYADVRAQARAAQSAAELALESLNARETALVAHRDSVVRLVQHAQGAGPADRLRALILLERDDAIIRFISAVFFFVCIAVDLTPVCLKMFDNRRDAYEAFVEAERERQVRVNDIACDAAVHAATMNAQRQEAELAFASMAAQGDFATALNARDENRADPAVAFANEMMRSDMLALREMLGDRRNRGRHDAQRDAHHGSAKRRAASHTPIPDDADIPGGRGIEVVVDA